MRYDTFLKLLFFAAIILTVVHIGTGFIEGEGYAAQPDAAILGIKLHTGVNTSTILFGWN